MSGRFPLARDLAEFWDNLCRGRDCIRQVPPERGELLRGDRGSSTRATWGGFIDEIDAFDPQFFGISTREAELMDPQQRLFLQCAWSAIEDAGCDPTRLAGTATGVFVGVATADYASIVARAEQERQAHSPIGCFHSILANRLSYLLDLRGPSQPIDTACSSSLVALHRAIQALRSGQCTQAIVGGVNALLTTPLFDAFEHAGMLSPDHRCRTFDAGANGYVRGEGVGVLFLKPLARAVADGDAIHAVLRGSAEGHGGRASSLTAPTSQAQADVLVQAYRDAGIEPRTIGYVEAHGTGTALGDPVEIDGLKQAFAAFGGPLPEGICALGSVKTSIGHLEAAAGMAGVIKAVLALKHGMLPGNLHFTKPNPYLGIEGSPFRVMDRTRSWEAIEAADGGRLPRRAGVSSFGFGGVNAHVVLEEYVAAAPTRSEPDREHAIVLSARTEERLRESAAQLLDFVRAARDGATAPALAEIAYTLQVGRAAMDERLAVRVNSIAMLEAALGDFVAGREVAGLHRGRVAPHDATLALFADDDVLREAVRKWLEQGRWDRLLELWTRGLRIDWNELYRDGHPSRVHLPTYRFARERYWVQPATAAASSATGNERSAALPQRRACLLEKRWEASALAASAPIVGPVLILATADSRELAVRVQGRLAQAEVLLVDSTELVSRSPSTAYSGWIDLTGCGARVPAPSAWMTAVQRLVERGSRSGSRALGVTRGLESFQNPTVASAGALQAALYRMLTAEYAAVQARHLDLDARADVDTTAAQIVAEFGGAEPDSTACYRSGIRYRAELEERTFVSADRGVAFGANHVLWITGGTRGLGTLCASHFVRQAGVKKLVLTGREPLPPRNEWLARAQEPGQLGEKIRAVRALEAEGVEVRAVALDLTDVAAVRRCRDEVTREMGPIGGLLHCAGSVDRENPAFIRKTADEIARVFAPKVTGTDCLLEALKDEPLAFAVLFSSISAAVPSLAAGLSDYAMANAHLDAIAEARAYAFPVISIRWPSWRETGMGEIRSDAYARAGLLSITNVEGLRFLDAILTAKTTGVVTPVVCDPARWQPSSLLRHALRATTGTGAPVPPDPSASSATGTGTSDASSPTGTLGWLTDLFARELKMPAAKLNPDTPFQDYGMDSILLAQAWKQINRSIGANLDPSAVFEHRTLRALATWIGRSQPNLATPLSVTPAALAESRVETGTDGRLTRPQPAPSIMPSARADIAVIGMSCRFPGADNLEACWQLLREGRSAIARVPDTRWKNPEGWTAGLLENVTDFDPEHFLLTPEDARVMDPQALLLLEESLNLVHHAGYTPADVKGAAVGVYVGARAQTVAAPEQLAESRNPILAVGQNYLATNLSRFFDFHGPSLVVDTACSSALVAMNLAIQALQRGEIASAVVGGVSVLASDTTHRIFRQRNLLSRDGAFHLFDARASGVVLGEGVGLVWLKPLEQAIADGDRVYAVVKGLAVNNDGRTAGPATPNLQAQKAVMQAALDRAGVNPAAVEYLEVNGSGSEVTDLLELKSIDAIYGGARERRCSLGSIKPNIGHPLCAEGIAAFIKLALMLHHREQPPFLSGERPLAHFDLGASAFSFRREAAAWSGASCVAALNCFADGGTNVHAILARWDESPGHPSRSPIAPPALRRRNVRQVARNPWSTTLDVSHPFIANHRAYGQPLLPGLAYLDLLYQHLRDRRIAVSEVELANVSIRRPLAVQTGRPVQLQIDGEPRADAPWTLSIEGAEFAADGASTGRTAYVTAEVRRTPVASFNDSLDLEAVRASGSPTALAESYQHFEAKGLVHTGPMKAEGHVYRQPDAWVIELSLPAEARADAAAYLFHPTLIDGAAVGAGRMFDEWVAGEQRLFLPLFYGRFRAAASLRERCFVRVRKGTVRRKNELLYSDMEWFDETGRKVAELTDFAYKLVRDAALIQAAAATESDSGRDLPTPSQSAAMQPVGSGHSAPQPSASLGAAAELLRIVIGAKLKRSSHDVDLKRGYYEMGLDSSMLLDVVAALGRKLTISLSPTLLFEHATPAELAAHLESAYPAELARLPRAAVADEPAMPALVVRGFPLRGSSSAGAEDRATAEALVADLLGDRLALWIEGDELKVRIEAGRLTPPLGERIAVNADSIARVVGASTWLPLTRSQKRYWVLSTLQPGKSAYNNPIGMRLRGRVDLDRLREAFRVLVNTHHVLRATCPRLAKAPVVEIAPPVDAAPCRVTRLTASTAEARERTLRELAERESRDPINPAVGPNLRIHLIEAATDDVTVLLTAHHTVFDGYSYLPVMSELMRIYRALARGVAPSADSLVQYDTYALREQPNGDPRSRAWWQEQLRGAPAFVALPLDRDRTPVNAGHGDTRTLWIDPETFQAANAFLQEHRVTSFAFMLSLLKVAIAGWSGQKDLVFGTTVQCRDDARDRDVIGDFTNFIPIRTQIDAGGTFRGLLQQVYRTSLLSLEHKHFPFDEIVAMAAAAPRNINPVYNILVNQLPSITEMEARLSDDALRVSVSNNRLLNKSAMLDLRFEWYEENGGLRLICEYNTDLFLDATIEAFLGQFDDCLRARAYMSASLSELFARFQPARALRQTTSAMTVAAPTPRADDGDAEVEAFVISRVLAVKEVAGIEQLKDVNFFELGLGSFDVANLSAELEARYPDFVVGDLFKHPTIHALAAHLRTMSGAEPASDAPAAVAAADGIDFELFRT
jgi:acyl transferase domain-containing protein/NAD(P)-dependent dehydrogenase (short-subunit alcohol dehydrogenase family)/acyl carrier protein